MFYFCLALRDAVQGRWHAVIPPHRPRKLTAEELVETEGPQRLASVLDLSWAC
jgi:hypothetical protein